MHRPLSFIPAVSSLVALAAIVAVFPEREARACGGCFTGPPPPTQTASDITDERMLLTVSPEQTTLYDQIQYSGSPSSFAWVLPIHGTVDVGISADVLFDSMDALTQTQIIAPNLTCPGPPAACFSGDDDDSASFLGGEATAAPPPVTVTKAANVGPYETVQLHSTDASALNTWLATNGFEIPPAVTPVLDAYVAEGFDFLAMKLLPDEGIQSMRPVRVTTPGASLSLPLRMAAIGTGASVGITIWVVSDGRYEPQNFPWYRIDDSELVWDYTASASNYTTLRAQHEAALGGKGWEIESSLDVSVAAIQATILEGGQATYGYGYGYPTSDAGADYLPIDGADGGAESADQARDDDIQTLLHGFDTASTVRVTRIRSDISHAAMTQDFVLQAAADQSELTNVRYATTVINETCPLYVGCTTSGTGTLAQANESVNNSEADLQGGCHAVPDRPGVPSRYLGIGALVAFALIGLRRRRR
jgi:hypothetical protein